MDKFQAVATMAMNVLCIPVGNAGNLSVSRKNMSFSSIKLLYGFIY